MDTKICTSYCKQEKLLSEFNRNRTTKDGYTYECKQCIKAYNSNYYKLNSGDIKLEQNKYYLATKADFVLKEKRKISRNKYRAKRRKNKVKIKKIKISKREKVLKLREFINQTYKTAPCMDCGLSFLPVCMDFDHIKNKKYNVSKLIQNNSSLKLIENEIAKCDLVCANCHRKRTFFKKPYKITLRRKSKQQRELVFLFKNKCCMDCKQRFEVFQMDFDHMPGTNKVAGISKMLNNQAYSTYEILFEIYKCELVCANCHRIRTHITRKNKGQ